jgi:hypothetical protein
VTRASSRGMSGHHRPNRGLSDDWLTPPEIVRALGPFDLDPCASVDRPWPTASLHYTHAGLECPWHGRVWLNPPYSEQWRWVARLAAHDDGIALLFARTETEGFSRHVWPHCSALLFLRGRLHFHDRAGVRARFNAGAPSVLVAYGRRNAMWLFGCGLAGQVVLPVATIEEKVTT